MTLFLVFATSDVASIMRVPAFNSFQAAWEFMHTQKSEMLNDSLFKMHFATHEESFVKDRCSLNPHVWRVGVLTQNMVLLQTPQDKDTACIMAVPHSFWSS